MGRGLILAPHGASKHQITYCQSSSVISRISIANRMNSRHITGIHGANHGAIAKTSRCWGGAVKLFHYNPTMLKQAIHWIVFATLLSLLIH
jgi:hypothetical protein